MKIANPAHTKSFHQMASSIKAEPRAAQENFLRKRGWEPLLDRADIWFNPRRPGADAHDICTFTHAIEEACLEMINGPRKLAVHHHYGAEK